jgi:hypothetical protein
VDEAALAHCTRLQALMALALAHRASGVRALWIPLVSCSLLTHLCAPALWLPPNASLTSSYPFPPALDTARARSRPRPRLAKTCSRGLGQLRSHRTRLCVATPVRPRSTATAVDW